MSNDNDNDKEKKPLLLFQAKGEYGNSISDQSEQNRQVYHLAQRFSAESFSVCALCQKVYYLNWGIPFDFVFLPNKLDTLSQQVTLPPLYARGYDTHCRIGRSRTRTSEGDEIRERTTRWRYSCVTMTNTTKIILL